LGSFLPQSVVISEDRTFYWNIGIDPVGILRAIVTNVRKGQLREGASTITQQLARNALRQTYVGTGDTPGRKWREMVAALKLTATYSKREILTFYLNRVYHGLRRAWVQGCVPILFRQGAKPAFFE
jgi:membrane peptidoglycan carboxypeptidase